MAYILNMRKYFPSEYCGETRVNLLRKSLEIGQVWRSCNWNYYTVLEKLFFIKDVIWPRYVCLNGLKGTPNSEENTHVRKNFLKSEHIGQ